MDIQFGNPNSIYLLGLVIGGVVLMIWTLGVRRRAATRFASSLFREQLMPRGSGFRRGLSATLVTASLVLMVFTLMDIRWGKTTREVPQKGIEVVFALDVSRSMLAEDATPSRLSRAKQQIKDMVGEMAGDRVGLVVFAGQTKQSVPLTSHYDDFNQVLDSVGPHTLRVGGSRLGEAIQAAAEAFISKTNDHKAIVLFTDGEDQESDPAGIASQLHEKEGIRIFTVGLGDMDQGARIPDDQSRRGEFLMHQGQQVWSKLNGQVLQEIATETNGAYIPAGTKRVNMADVYHGYVANVPQTEFESATINAWIPRFQWFAGAALLLLLLEIWISTRKSKVRNQQSAVSDIDAVADTSDDVDARSSGRTSRPKVAAAGLLLALLPALPASAQMNADVANEINAANQLLREQKTAEAINALSAIDPREADRDTLNYNLAVAHYRNGDFESASTLFQQSATANDDAIAADSRYNLANCHYANALPLVEEDREAAIRQLQEAISNYRSALRLNHDNPDARINIELANRLIKQLQQMEKQEQQQPQNQDQQNQQNQDQQQQDQNQQQAQDQQQDQNQNNEQQDQSPQQQDQQSQDGQEQQQEDQSSSDQTQDGQQGQEQQNEPDSSPSGNPEQNEGQQNEDQQDSEQPDQDSADAQQKQNANQQQRQNPTDQNPDQQDSSDDAGDEETQAEETKETSKGQLTAANESGEKDDKQQQAAIVHPGEEEGLMSKEEALKMLQSVRDRDMLRRLRQEQRERSRRRPVDRDW